jgi:HK97 family phage portal protein
VLTVPAGMTKEQLDQAKTDWAAFNGPSNAGKIAVITADVKFTSLSMNASDAQLVDQLKWTAENICSCFHVPPYMVGVAEPPRGVQLEAILQMYYSQCLQSLITSFEDCLDEGLGIAGTAYGTEFDIDDLIWMDTPTKTKAAADAIGAGAISPDEARARYFGLGPVEGGDTPYMQQQMFSLKALAQRDAQDPFAKPTPAPMAAPVADQIPPDQVAATARHLLARALEAA